MMSEVTFLEVFQIAWVLKEKYKNCDKIAFKKSQVQLHDHLEVISCMEDNQMGGADLFYVRASLFQHDDETPVRLQ